MAIITPQEFKTFRNIGGKTDNDKIAESIKQAEIDLRELLGNAFYFDVEKNAADPAYKELMDGSEYTEGDYTLRHNGIKRLLADLTYSRYMYAVNNTHTPFGMVNKQYNDGQQVDRNMIRDIVKQTAIDADKNYELIKGYLEQNKDKFPAYNTTCQTNGTTSFKAVKYSFLSTNR